MRYRVNSIKNITKFACEEFGHNYYCFLLKKFWIEEIQKKTLMTYVMSREMPFCRQELFFKISLKEMDKCRFLSLRDEHLIFLFYCLNYSRLSEIRILVADLFLRILKEQPVFLNEHWDLFLAMYAALPIVLREYLQPIAEAFMHKSQKFKSILRNAEFG